MAVPIIYFDRSTLSANEAALLDVVFKLVPVSLALAMTAHEALERRTSSDPAESSHPAITHDDLGRAMERVVRIVRGVMPHLQAEVREASPGPSNDLLN